MDMVKNKIKVLHVHTMPVISGSGINTFLTMQGLNKEKYKVEFACAPEGPLIEKVVKEGIKFHPIKNLVQPISIIDDIKALFQIIVILKKENYHIVHTHNSKAGFLGRIAASLVHTSIIVHTIHGFAFHDRETLFCRKLFIYLERFASHCADRLIAISNPLKKWGLSLNIGKEKQYTIIYSGIEISRFRKTFDIQEEKIRLGISPDDLVVGVVSKLWEGKGHRCILEAVKIVTDKIPNVKFVIVGEGYLMDELKNMTKEKIGRAHV